MGPVIGPIIGPVIGRVCGVATRSASRVRSPATSFATTEDHASMMDRRRLIAASLLLPGVAQGQAGGQAPEPWPSRPVRILLAYPPGGSTDVLARTLADRL